MMLHDVPKRLFPFLVSEAYEMHGGEYELMGDCIEEAVSFIVQQIMIDLGPEALGYEVHNWVWVHPTRFYPTFRQGDGCLCMEDRDLVRIERLLVELEIGY